MSDRFWSVAELNKVTEIEINHYIPQDDESLEAYDVRMKDPTSLHNFCFDLPPKLAKDLYKKLKEVLNL